MDDTEKLKKIALMLLNNLRGSEFDLIVYKSVLRGIAGPRGTAHMEMLLQKARKDPALRKSVLERFDKIEKGLQQLGQKDADTALLEALKAWNPGGPTN